MSEPQPAAEGGGGPRPLSCVSCRTRKVKCNKVYPCDQCLKAGIHCVFPHRKRTGRPRRPHQNELLDRISRLEKIVGKVDPADLQKIKGDIAARGSGAGGASGTGGAGGAGDAGGAGGAGEAYDAIWPFISLPPAHPEVLCAGPPRDPVFDEGPREGSSAGTRSPPSPDYGAQASQYLGPQFWNQLCSEVEGLKQVLAQQSDSDDEDDLADSSPGSQAQTAEQAGRSIPNSLFGNTMNISVDQIAHPPSQHILYLCTAYFQGVDIILKVLHRPTITKTIEAVAHSPDKSSIDKGTEALIFAMYYGAVTSLTPEVCLVNLGETRAVLSARYRLATEMALARADYLNCTTLEPLQALAIYIVRSPPSQLNT